MPISHPSYYAGYLAKRHGPYRHARPGRGHVGAERGRDRRRHLPAAGPRHRRRAPRRCASRPSISCDAARWSASSTPPIASSTCSGGTRRGPSGASHRRARRAQARHPRALQARTTRWSARCWRRVRHDDVLMVLSDHGFSAFRRGVNLNAWLQREGYLTLVPGRDGSAEWLRDVDWASDARLLRRAERDVPEPARPRAVRQS